MNRRERRARAAAAKKAIVDPVVAAHEAGHAIARFLTASMMGLPEDKAIDSIVVHPEDAGPKGESVNGVFEMHETEDIGGGLSRSIVKDISKEGPNMLLKKLIKEVEIHAFAEKIPSMNEIFISHVKS